MQRPTYGISLGNYYKKRPCQPRFRVCTSLAPRPMTVVFGLGTRLHVRIRTTLENGVLRNGQQPDRAENSFIDQGEFVAIKRLSSCKAPCCHKHQFCAKMTVSTWTVFEISLLNFVVLTRMRKMALWLPHTFLFSCLLRGFWALMSLADHKGTQWWRPSA